MFLFFAGSVCAQVADSTAPPPSKTAEPQKVYFGGTLGLSFGSYFRVSLEPFVGYHLAPSLTGGVKFIYEYIRDESYNTTYTSSNYGGGLFANYQFHPRIYFHSEFEYINYGYSISATESARQWVPFLYLGGGVIQPISPTTSAYVEISVDVIQDSHSPYKAWSPAVSAGVAVGL
jgi:hypothetical protein